MVSGQTGLFVSFIGGMRKCPQSSLVGVELIWPVVGVKTHKGCSVVRRVTQTPVFIV